MLSNAFCKVQLYTRVNYATYNYIGVGTGEEGVLFYNIRFLYCASDGDVMYLNRACDSQIEPHIAYDHVN